MKNEKADLQRTAITAMYRNYLEMGLNACNSFNNTPLEDELMKEIEAEHAKIQV